MASLLPNGKQYFVDDNGNPLVAGQVFSYVPNTSTKKNTFQDPGQTILNTNPVILDARGEAIIWGSGSYRQVVYDQFGNLIWDQVTEDPNAGITGDMVDATFSAGTDFTPGVTTALTLPSAFGSVSNIWVFFDGTYQGDDQIQSLEDFTLTFTSPIPVGVQKVYVKGGTTVAIGVPADGSITNAKVAANAGISGTKLSFLQAGAGAVPRTVQDKERDIVSVKDFGAKGDGASDDTQAFLAAIAALQTGTEEQGGTIHIPRGHYIIKRTLEFTPVDAVTSYFLEGDGSINTVLDFSQLPSGAKGIYFNSGSSCGLRGLFIAGAAQTSHGVVLNDQVGSAVSQVRLQDLRVQSFGGDGVYSFGSYLISVDGTWSTNNSGMGYNFAGGHTSIITNRMYASNNGSVGIRINGAIYIDINGQADGNLRGFQFSNIRGGLVRAPGTESNRGEGIVLLSSDASAAGMVTEAQDIHGLTIIGACLIRNNASGPVGANANIAVSTADNRPISFTLIGCVDNVVSGDPSVALSGDSGLITMKHVSCQFQGAVAIANSVNVANLDRVGSSALTKLNSATQSIPSGVLTQVAATTLVVSTLPVTTTSTTLIVPANTNTIRVTASVEVDANSTGVRQLFIQRNGAIVPGSGALTINAPSAGTAVLNVQSSLIGVVPGDTISMALSQTSGLALNIQQTNNTFLSIEGVS